MNFTPSARQQSFFSQLSQSAPTNPAKRDPSSRLFTQSFARFLPCIQFPHFILVDSKEVLFCQEKFTRFRTTCLLKAQTYHDTGIQIDVEPDSFLRPKVRDEYCCIFQSGPQQANRLRRGPTSTELLFRVSSQPDRPPKCKWMQ